jgi:hypothetical protein
VALRCEAGRRQRCHHEHGINTCGNQEHERARSDAVDKAGSAGAHGERWLFAKMPASAGMPERRGALRALANRDVQ